MKTNLGETLKKIRKIKKLTQFNIEQKSGVEHCTYVYTESDKNDLRLSTLNRIANGFEIPLGVILWLGIDETSIPKENKHEFLMAKEKVDAIFKNLYDLN